MANLFWGYNVNARGREGLPEGNTWYIDNLDTGERILINHIEIKTAITTIEKSIDGKGFGMLCENAKIEYAEHESVGKYVIIRKE